MFKAIRDAGRRKLRPVEDLKAPMSFILKVMRRLALAYHRTQDRVLLERGIMFTGTPARRFSDIENYTSHAAIHRLEGLNLPQALGRPGIAPHAWFADPQSADAISRRHGGYVTRALFEVIMADFPVDAVRTPENRVTEGHIQSPHKSQVPFTVYAKEMTAVAVRHAERPIITPDSSAAPTRAAEHRLFALVQVADDISGAAVFQRSPGSDLYRLVLIGMRDRSASPASDVAHRLDRRAFKKFIEAIRFWPGVTFDFIGAAEPPAAAMGFSLFRYLRNREMRRLQTLSDEAYTAERRRVTAYQYPTFPRRAVVTRRDTLKAMLKEIPRWALNTVRPMKHPQTIVEKGEV